MANFLNPDFKAIWRNLNFKRELLPNYLTVERYQVLRQAVDYTKAESVNGGYLEFGVAWGRSLIFADSLLGKDIPIIGFDSFRGFPKPKGVDKKLLRFKHGEDAYGQQIVESNLRKWCRFPTRVTLISGFFDKSLTPSRRKALPLQKARIINVDCDMYESTKDVLSFVTPLLQQGTVILFDDWLCYKADSSKGEQRAVAEWLKKNKKIRLLPYRSYANVGQAFIVSQI